MYILNTVQIPMQIIYKSHTYIILQNDKSCCHLAWSKSLYKSIKKRLERDEGSEGENKAARNSTDVNCPNPGTHQHKFILQTSTIKIQYPPLPPTLQNYVDIHVS